MINFQSGGDTQQHEESEIHHRVHKTCCAVAQQCAHVDTRAVIGKTTLHVLWGGATTIWRAALPVTNAICKAERTPHEHRGDNRVESNFHGAWNATKHNTVDFRIALPSGDEGHNARHHGEESHSCANCNGQLVRAQALWGLIGLRNSVRAHNEYNASAI